MLSFLAVTVPSLAWGPRADCGHLPCITEQAPRRHKWSVSVGIRVCLWRGRRRRVFAATSALCIAISWCGASLFVKELFILYLRTGFQRVIAKVCEAERVKINCMNLLVPAVYCSTVILANSARILSKEALMPPLTGADWRLVSFSLFSPFYSMTLLILFSCTITALCSVWFCPPFVSHAYFPIIYDSIYIYIYLHISFSL